MASITCRGFCEVAALSRYTSGLPWTVCLSTGKSSRTFSTSNAAEIWLLRLLIEFLEQDPLERIPQGLRLYAIHNVLREGIGQQAARVLPVDTPGAQVEKRLGVQLPDGRAVRAAHVVRPDLQFGLGVDHRIVGENQVLVGLLRVGLLCVFADDDAAVEHGRGTPVQNTLVQLVAGGMRFCMIDRRVIVDVLRS